MSRSDRGDAIRCHRQNVYPPRFCRCNLTDVSIVRESETTTASDRRYNFGILKIHASFMHFAPRGIFEMQCSSHEIYNPFSKSCQAVACSDINNHGWQGSCQMTTGTVGRLACAPANGSATPWQCDVPYENYACLTGLTKCSWDFDAVNGNEQGCKGKVGGTKCSRRNEDATLIGYCANDQCCLGEGSCFS